MFLCEKKRVFKYINILFFVLKEKRLIWGMRVLSCFFFFWYMVFVEMLVVVKYDKIILYVLVLFNFCVVFGRIFFVLFLIFGILLVYM